jgi:hypothetical protein
MDRIHHAPKAALTEHNEEIGLAQPNFLMGEFAALRSQKCRDSNHRQSQLHRVVLGSTIGIAGSGSGEILVEELLTGCGSWGQWPVHSGSHGREMPPSSPASLRGGPGWCHILRCVDDFDTQRRAHARGTPQAVRSLYKRVTHKD